VLPEHDSLVPTQASGPTPTIRTHARGDAEARAVARELRNAHSASRRWSDMAVLVRTNAQVVLMSELCAELGVPVHARTDRKLLDRPEINDALDDMRSAPTLELALNDLSGKLANTAVAEDAEADEGADDHRSLVEAFIRLGRDHLAVDPAATVQSFVSALRTGATDLMNAPGDAVDITTFHAAKGLEWDIVHVAGMERGLSPIGHAKTPEALEEEHRLVYVALTRARKKLHLHWAQERLFGDRVSNRHPSPMLDVIAAASRGEDPRSRRKGAARHASDAKKNLRAKNGGKAESRVPDDDPVLVALKSWRSSVAKANDVPADVVFHDSTLHAIAEHKPESEAQLQSLPGLGPVKVARYGDDLLRLVSETV
jgi:DNA helicase-2/ATP-dependent DNA helicase PcrA